MIKVLRVCTVPISLIGYKSHLNELVDNGIDLHVATSPSSDLGILEEDSKFKVHSLHIYREIKLLQDLKSVFKLWCLIRRVKPDVVHSNTPKAGIVTTVASLLAKVPIRVHTFTGQRWTTLTGVKRNLLIFIDLIIIKLNTVVLADSHSQKEFLNNFFRTSSVNCLGEGSFGGVDFEKFNYSKLDKSDLRRRLGISDSDFVVLYLGRIVKDKGIRELVEAFISLGEGKLLLVGPIECEENPVDEKTLEEINQNEDIIWFDFTNEPEKYFMICDVFCLPSYREGFGSVVIEAAALGKPSIGSDIYGISDAIKDGKTGLLFKVGSVEELSSKLRLFIEKPDLIQGMGAAAYERAREDFSSTRVSEKLVNFYKFWFNKKNL